MVRNGEDGGIIGVKGYYLPSNMVSAIKSVQLCLLQICNLSRKYSELISGFHIRLISICCMWPFVTSKAS